MKAIRVHQVGGPEVLQYENVPEPVPGPSQAVVAIRAVGVNYTDVASRNGTNPPDSFPWTPGREAAGIVTAVGEKVTEVTVGDRVAYAMYTGSYAQKQAVPSWLLVRIPEGMNFGTAAATMLQGMTAHFLVFGLTHLNPGDQVLVHAGAGGMGLWLIQMLKRLGVFVFATVSTEVKAKLASDVGADHVIIYTSCDFQKEIIESTDGQGVHMVLDAVGQTTFDKGLDCLRPRGYMVLYGQASGPVTKVDSTALRKGSFFLTRPSLGDYTSTREELLQRADEVLGWVHQGAIKLHVGLTLPLTQAQEAHRQLEGRQTTGKILLTP